MQQPRLKNAISTSKLINYLFRQKQSVVLLSFLNFSLLCFYLIIFHCYSVKLCQVSRIFSIKSI